LKLKLTQAITSRLFSVVREMLNLTIGPTLIPPKKRNLLLQERITLGHLFDISLTLSSAVLLEITRESFVIMR